MKTKICTTLEQSKKLISIGLDPNSADMYYKYILPKSDKMEHNPHVGNPVESLKWYNKGYTFSGKNKPLDLSEYCIPSWSLSALLNIMPRTISIRVDDRSANFYRLEWQFANDNSLRYIGSDRQTLIDIYSDHDSKYKDEIDTAVEMVIWLKENGYIKK